MEKNIKDYELILNSMNDVLDDLTDKQSLLREAVKSKNWENLLEIIKNINLLSDYFTSVDETRDEMQNQFTEEELKPYLPTLRTLRSKLLKCKVENKVLNDYVNITRQFIQEVVDEALPVKGNKNYSRNGSMTQPQLQSVLVDIRG